MHHVHTTETNVGKDPLSHFPNVKKKSRKGHWNILIFMYASMLVILFSFGLNHVSIVYTLQQLIKLVNK